jgi:hypothetical protein
MPASLQPAVPYLLAIGTSFLPRGASRRHGAFGAVLVTLAIAAAGRVTAAAVSFHTINNTMLWGGLLLGCAALAEGWKRGQRAGLLPLALALMLTLAGCGALLWQGHVIVSLLAGLAGAATVVALPLKPLASVGDGVAGSGGITGLVRRWGMPLLLVLLLVPALGLLLTVAGSGGASLRGLRDAPLSSAAETLLAALLLPATLVLAAVFPFGPVARGPRFAPVGALLLLVAVVPLLGEGLEHWRSLYAGWLAVGAVVTAWKAQWPRVLACAGLFGIACGGGSVWWAGTLLTVLASLLSWPQTAHEQAWRPAMLAAAACGIAALQATLGVEVVYSAVLVIAVLVGILRTPMAGAAGD